jgi:hypothetical protein
MYVGIGAPRDGWVCSRAGAAPAALPAVLPDLGGARQSWTAGRSGFFTIVR